MTFLFMTKIAPGQKNPPLVHRNNFSDGKLYTVTSIHGPFGLTERSDHWRPD